MAYLLAKQRIRIAAGPKAPPTPTDNAARAARRFRRPS